MERHAHACTQTLIRQFVPSGGVEEQGGKNGIVPLTRGMTHCMMARVLFLRMSQRREHGQEGRMQSKQAKIISPAQEKALLGSVATTRSPARDRVMVLLSMKAGLRAKAMASLTWAMVTDAPGQVAEVMHVPNRARKGTTGGRTMPMHPDLHIALGTLQTWRGDMATP